MSFRIRPIVPILIIFLGVFLRFYRFDQFVMFLGDQGRDAIIIKRIVTLEHFPAIGPPSSLNQVYLGPFYYYLVAPFLLLFNFNPVGLAFAVALFSLIGSIVTYFLIKKELGSSTALIFLILLFFSAINIQFSRFSWNPNLLPIFSFFTLYFFYKLLLTKNKWYSIAFGAFLSFSIQLHHLALLFIPVIFFFGIYFLRKVKLSNYLIAILFFLFFSLPLFIFDLRHNFLNTKNLLKFFAEGNPTDHKQLITRFLQTNSSFYSHVFQLNFNQYLALFFTFFILLFLFKKAGVQKYLFLQINLFSFIFYLFLFSF